MTSPSDRRPENSTSLSQLGSGINFRTHLVYIVLFKLYSGFLNLILNKAFLYFPYKSISAYITDFFKLPSRNAILELRKK